MDDKNNVYTLTSEFSEHEVFTDLLKKDNIHIEKIISYGQTTPQGRPYLQAHDEWVLILKGQAKLKLADKEHILEQGQYLLIPKNVKHWVTFTANPTIWLAIHIKV